MSISLDQIDAWFAEHRTAMESVMDAFEQRQRANWRKIRHEAAALSMQSAGVYFIQAGSNGPIKIGIASNVHRRMALLQIGNPAQLTLLAIQPGGNREETALHRRFAACHLRGEWFNPDPLLLAYIRSL